MLSITLALGYLLISDAVELANPTFDKTYTYGKFSDIPYFFGISLFLFEGNALSLEIEYQMHDGNKNFMRALGPALLITITMVVTVGALSYAAFAQYTSDLILLNLSPGVLTYIVQIFYSVGILCSYCLQIIPTYKVLRIFSLYNMIPESKTYPFLKSAGTRISFVLFCASIGYFIPSIG